MSGIPEEWIELTLGKVIEYGKTDKVQPTEINSDCWVLELEDIQKDSSIILEKKNYGQRKSKSTKNLFEKGNVLYGKLRPYLNKVVIAEESGVCSTEIIPIKTGTYINNIFLFYWLKSSSFLSYVNDVSYGVNMPRLGTKDGKNAPFILPPLAEQKEIASRLDLLLGQVEKIKVRIDGIPAILRSFRQSVLAAAVSGKLTEEWREGTDYKWIMGTIDDLGEVKGGKRLPEGAELVEMDTGLPYIRAGQLKNGTVINTNESRSKQMFLTPDVQQRISRYTVNKNDLYLTIVGASIGDAGIIPEKYHGANLTENAAKICNFKKPLESKFLSYWLRSHTLQHFIQLEIKSGAQGKLALKRIKELPAPYTNIVEQKEIVRRVEMLLALADSIEQKVQATQERVDNLTQSILAKAFRGELTQEWREENLELISGENSAEALLERIKNEKKTTIPIIKKASRGKKMSSQKEIIHILDALRKVEKSLSSQELLQAAGYPNDSSTDQIETFFLDIRESLKNGEIEKTRKGDTDYFQLSTGGKS